MCLRSPLARFRTLRLAATFWSLHHFSAPPHPKPALFVCDYVLSPPRPEPTPTQPASFSDMPRKRKATRRGDFRQRAIAVPPNAIARQTPTSAAADSCEPKNMLRIASWNVRGISTPAQAVALAAWAAEQAVDVLLLQDTQPTLGSSAEDAAAFPLAELPGPWQLFMVPATDQRVPRVAIAVRAGAGRVQDAVLLDSAPYAVTVRLALHAGVSVASHTTLMASSVYWPPDGASHDAAFLDVITTLGRQDDGLHIVGGDFNAPLGDTEAAGLVPISWLGQECLAPAPVSHSEVPCSPAASTAARYATTCAETMGAAFTGSLAPVDGMLQVAEPTFAQQRPDGSTVERVLDHMFFTETALHAVNSCGVAAAASPAAAAAVAVLNSDHRPLVLALTADGSTAAASGAGIPVEATPPSPRLTSPDAAPERRTVTGAALNSAAPVVLDLAQRHLCSESVQQRQHGLGRIENVITDAIQRQPQRASVKRGRRSPQLFPDALLKHGGAALERAMALAEAARDAPYDAAMQRKLRDSLATAERKALDATLLAAALASEAHDGRGVAAALSAAKAVHGSALGALGALPQGEAAQHPLPASLTVGDSAPILCPDDADDATLSAMATALQEGLAAVSVDAGVTPAWQLPSDGVPLEPPTLDVDRVAAIVDGSRRLAPATTEPLPADVPFSEGEVRAALHRLPNGRARGFDCLAAEHWKSAHEVVVVLLTFLFNAIVAAGCAPPSWATSRLVPLPKRAAPRTLAHWRPISIVAVLPKLFASILHRRLQAAAQAVGVPGDAQHGFRPQRSTLTALLAITEAIRLRIAAGLSCVVVALDFKKAFDRVPRDGLRSALSGMGLPDSVVDKIAVLYQMTGVQLRVGRGKAALQTALPSATNTGVRQGCPLSPLLYAIFVDSLRGVVDAAVQLAVPGGGSVSVLISFADDVTLTVASDADANSAVAAVHAWCTVHGVELAWEKTQVMRFGPAAANKDPFVLHRHGMEALILPISSHIKVLGVMLDADLSGVPHAKYRAAVAGKRAEQLAASGVRGGMAPLPLVRAVFKAYVEPTLYYGAELFQTPAAIGVLDGALRRCAAVMLGLRVDRCAPRCLLMELGVVPARAVVLKASACLLRRCLMQFPGDTALGHLLAAGMKVSGALFRASTTAAAQASAGHNFGTTEWAVALLQYRETHWTMASGAAGALAPPPLRCGAFGPAVLHAACAHGAGHLLDAAASHGTVTAGWKDALSCFCDKGWAWTQRSVWTDVWARPLRPVQLQPWWSAVGGGVSAAVMKFRTGTAWRRTAVCTCGAAVSRLHPLLVCREREVERNAALAVVFDAMPELDSGVLAHVLLGTHPCNVAPYRRQAVEYAQRLLEGAPEAPAAWLMSVYRFVSSAPRPEPVPAR